MVKRRDLIKELELDGFKNMGGASHDNYEKGLIKVPVPRHREILDTTANQICRQAGLR
jgi:mRNA interferase HicA